MKKLNLLIAVSIIAALTAGCSSSNTTRGSAPSPIAETHASPTATAGAVAPGAIAPQPLSFPKDDWPHKSKTEWWYYNGHVSTNRGERYGFHFVIFQRLAEEGRAGYVGHFAVTDLSKKTFAYAQKLELGYIPEPTGDDAELKVGDWTLKVGGGTDTFKAGMEGYSFALDLSGVKPPVLHGGTGFITVAKSEQSYYYSRTRMAAIGYITVDGVSSPVVGSVWFDHQWGDFILQGGGGWDWYGLQLSDVSEVMVSVIRGPDGRVIEKYGTYVDPKGAVAQLADDDIKITPTSEWKSPRSGATYPMGWRVLIKSQDLDLTLTPPVRDQELDARDSTDVVYWEGSVALEGSKKGQSITGAGYVEMTGYAPKG